MHPWCPRRLASIVIQLALAAAAAGRVGESLRVLEEVGSTVSPAFSAGIQAIRHGWYDLDRDLRLRLGARAPVVQPRLCVLLTRDLCPRGDWVRIVDALAEAGVDMVQIREKSCSDGELLRHADAVRSRLPSSTRLVVNDRVAVAAALLACATRRPTRRSRASRSERRRARKRDQNENKF